MSSFWFVFYDALSLFYIFSGFKDYDGLKYDVTQLHNDCTELFAYFNHRIIAVLVKCTKTSLEKLKNRTNLTK